MPLLRPIFILAVKQGIFHAPLLSDIACSSLSFDTHRFLLIRNHLLGGI